MLANNFYSLTRVVDLSSRPVPLFWHHPLGGPQKCFIAALRAESSPIRVVIVTSRPLAERKTYLKFGSMIFPLLRGMRSNSARRVQIQLQAEIRSTSHHPHNQSQHHNDSNHTKRDFYIQAHYITNTNWNYYTWGSTIVYLEIERSCKRVMCPPEL